MGGGKGATSLTWAKCRNKGDRRLETPNRMRKGNYNDRKKDRQLFPDDTTGPIEYLEYMKYWRNMTTLQ